jgi:hypothetical protein
VAAKAARKITIAFSGDINGTQEFDAEDNSSSPATTGPLSLTTGANTIIVPTGGAAPTCCTIVKPSDNTATITLKGISGDTGVKLHPTDPDSISIASDVTQFVLTVSADVNLRFVWS